MVIETPELKVKETCDQLIAWGFCCNEKAEFLVKKSNSVEYAIMCGKHKQEFEKVHSNIEVEFFDYSLELNQQFANIAKKHWENKV